MECSRCLAPLPAGTLGGVVKCAYCGQETRVPSQGLGPIPGLPVTVVGSGQTLEERMAMTREANRKLIEDERRAQIRIAIPLAIVAVAAGAFAILRQVGCI